MRIGLPYRVSVCVSADEVCAASVAHHAQKLIPAVLEMPHSAEKLTVAAAHDSRIALISGSAKKKTRM